MDVQYAQYIISMLKKTVTQKEQKIAELQSRIDALEEQIDDLYRSRAYGDSHVS